MAKNKTNGTKVETATKADIKAKADDTDAITASMFNVTIEGAGDGSKWRVSIEAGETHPTENGIVYMATVKGEIDSVPNAVAAALADLCDDE